MLLPQRSASTVIHILSSLTLRPISHSCIADIADTAEKTAVSIDYGCSDQSRALAAAARDAAG